jgi:hypothetical protein
MTAASEVLQDFNCRWRQEYLIQKMTRPTTARITHLINLFDHVNNSDTTLVIKPSKGECCHSLVKFIGNQTSFLALNINNA